MGDVALSGRVSTGWDHLDALLGGGLVPGTMTVLLGATGIGKTQLGVRFAHAGLAADHRPGVILDLAARGDSQNHSGYAQRMFDWTWDATDRELVHDETFFSRATELGPYRKAFERQGHRVTRRDLDPEAWDAWQRELNVRLTGTIAFLYANLIAGCRRLVIDGIEPTERAGESIQFELIEYLYHQLLRKECDWVARDVFRERFARLQPLVETHRYPHDAVSCLALVTSQAVMLDDLLVRPLSEGDLLSNANTVIVLGKIRRDQQLSRALCIVKHRGSACSDAIHEYRIHDRGLELVD